MRKEKTYKLADFLYTPSASIADGWDSENDKERARARARQYTTLFIRTYESEERFLDILRALEGCDAWAYIVHDKDKNEDGSPKEAHIHAMLHFPPDARLRLTTLGKLVKQNTRVEIPLDPQGCLDYMLHANAPEKHQYDVDERISHNTDILLGTRRSSEARKVAEVEAKNSAFIADLCDLSRQDMAIRYGRDFIKNFRRYEDFKDCIVDRKTDADTALLAVRDNVEKYLPLHNDPLVQYDVRYSVADALFRELYLHIQKHSALPDASRLLAIYCQALVDFYAVPDVIVNYDPCPEQYRD